MQRMAVPAGSTPAQAAHDFAKARAWLGAVVSSGCGGAGWPPGASWLPARSPPPPRNHTPPVCPPVPAPASDPEPQALHARWGVGDAACENGVVLLLSVQDRQVYVSTGKGARVWGGSWVLARTPAAAAAAAPAAAAAAVAAAAFTAAALRLPSLPRASVVLLTCSSSLNDRPNPCTCHFRQAGSKRLLNAERIDDVIADMRPALRRADYDAAMERAMVDIGLALAGGRPGGARIARAGGRAGWAAVVPVEAGRPGAIADTPVPCPALPLPCQQASRWTGLAWPSSACWRPWWAATRSRPGAASASTPPAAALWPRSSGCAPRLPRPFLLLVACLVWPRPSGRRLLPVRLLHWCWQRLGD